MTRLSVSATVIAAGIPLTGISNWTVACTAVGATVLLLTALQRKSLCIAVMGGMLAIAEMALASPSISPDLILLRPAAVGLALLYVLEEVEYAARASCAHVDTAARRTRHRGMLRQAIAAVATCGLLAALVAGTAAYSPLRGSPRIIVGAAGAVVALLAAFTGASGIEWKKRSTRNRDKT
jgi:hypothetical protein